MTRAVTPRHSLSAWKLRHSIVIWAGIVLNLSLAVPLLLAPLMTLAFFKAPGGDTVWTPFAGGLLIMLSVFYVPMTLDLDRYRVFAWLAVFPSRTFGVIFFLTAVLVYGQPSALFLGVLIDGAIGIASLYCLIQITQLEQGVVTGRVPT